VTSSASKYVAPQINGGQTVVNVMLEAAAFDNEPIDLNEAQRLIEQAEDLLASVR
jgi:hypothetical protein